MCKAVGKWNISSLWSYQITLYSGLQKAGWVKVKIHLSGIFKDNPQQQSYGEDIAMSAVTDSTVNRYHNEEESFKSVETVS